jgi:triosephosphate isomerase
MKLIVANWKMNYAFDEADEWLDVFFEKFAANYEKLSKVEMVLCPSAIMLDYIDSELMEDGLQNLEKIMQNQRAKFEDFSAEELNEILIKQRPIKLGAQDCHHEKNGAFTGDLSASMLVAVGCQYVILGHSERRQTHFENNQIIAKKTAAALNEKLLPIICLGENIETRNDQKHLEFIEQQIFEMILPNQKFEKLIIAYEPIWSIGTGITPTAAQILEVAQFIKKIISQNFANNFTEFYLLYGGSVNAKNSAEILAVEGIEGLLVGKAALDVEEFVKICVS